ncbi:hypothetical protein EDD16DRAFT_19813 [Pisolithus croceorrhizus]|nr:hypothetical protein EDD16DRAFT_19813 [Pisolithus croceorrhizus]
MTALHNANHGDDSPDMRMTIPSNQVIQGVRREGGLMNNVVILLEATAAMAITCIYGGVKRIHLDSAVTATPWNILLGLINLISYSLVTTSNGIMRRSNTSEGQTPGPDRIKCIRKTQQCLINTTTMQKRLVQQDDMWL